MQNHIQKVASEMVRLRKIIHQNPEPAFEERDTAARIVEQLETIPGIQLQKEVAKTGVVATLGPDKPGPCIGLRADMDCLRMQEQNEFEHVSQKNGLMHACGHDGHIVCLLGAALVLGQIQEKLKGPVKFLFQPAEENFGGGKHMVDEGALESPDVKAIFGLHGTPELRRGKVGVNVGAVMAASRYFKITVYGKGTHAAMPHLGIDPVLIGSHIITGVQSIVSRNMNPSEAGLISIPKFMGSTAPNVIPDKVVMEGTLRALSNTTRDLLQERLRTLVEQVALAHGGSAEISFDAGYPLLENENGCVDYFVGVAESVLGKGEVDSSYPASLGAEDFAFYSERVPSTFWWLGLQTEEQQVPSLHNPRFDFNDDAIPLAIQLHCRLALNFQECAVTVE